MHAHASERVNVVTIDSGMHSFAENLLFWRVDDVAMTLINKKKIGDGEWKSYLEGAQEVTTSAGNVPTTAMIQLADAYPNATQRKMAQIFMAKHGVRLVRLALLTDNETLLGVMTAFGWLVPNLTVRAFPPDSSQQALVWLAEKNAGVPVEHALSCLRKMRSKLGLR